MALITTQTDRRFVSTTAPTTFTLKAGEVVEIAEDIVQEALRLGFYLASPAALAPVEEELEIPEIPPNLTFGSAVIEEAEDVTKD